MILSYQYFYKEVIKKIILASIINFFLNKKGEIPLLISGITLF
ncbi:hypothetical protein FLAVO9AF_110089 [Flavobacterium sp. 9AF]|nr:hypothetical protein FLAVO9AF_110089 [Flavobacterium sp. 9AF]